MSLPDQSTVTPAQRERQKAGFTVEQAAARLPRFLRVCSIATFRQYERDGFPQKWAISLASVYGCLPMMLSQGRHQAFKQRKETENENEQLLQPAQGMRRSSSLRRSAAHQSALTTKKKNPARLS